MKGAWRWYCDVEVLKALPLISTPTSANRIYKNNQNRKEANQAMGFWSLIFFSFNWNTCHEDVLIPDEQEVKQVRVTDAVYCRDDQLTKLWLRVVPKERGRLGDGEMFRAFEIQ